MTRRIFLAVMAGLSVISSFGSRRIEGDDLLWGTYGESGLEPLRWVPLRDCDTDHLQSILRTQAHVYEDNPQAVARLKAIKAILKSRMAHVPLYVGWTAAEIQRVRNVRTRNVKT